MQRYYVYIPETYNLVYIHMLISSTIHNNRRGDSVLTSGVLTLVATISCCRDTNSSCFANLRIFFGLNW